MNARGMAGVRAARSGLPERFAEFLMGGLCVKSDIAQQVRVQMAKPLAVPAARKGHSQGAGKAADEAGAVVHRGNGGFGP